MNIIKNKNTLGNYPVYVQRYLDLVPEQNLQLAFNNQLPKAEKIIRSISEKKSIYKYAEGKWTLKELLQHCIDTEKIFCYRALCFSRKDKVMLAGYDENNYATNSNANNRLWANLVEEFFAVRKSSEIFFATLTDDALQQTGIANNYESSVISIGFLIVGHLTHHLNIITTKYL